MIKFSNIKLVYPLFIVVQNQMLLFPTNTGLCLVDCLPKVKLTCLPDLHHALGSFSNIECSMILLCVWAETMKSTGRSTSNLVAFLHVKARQVKLNAQSAIHSIWLRLKMGVMHFIVFGLKNLIDLSLRECKGNIKIDQSSRKNFTTPSSLENVKKFPSLNP